MSSTSPQNRWFLRAGGSVALILLVGVCACSAAREPLADDSKAVKCQLNRAGTLVGTWDGTTAYVTNTDFEDICATDESHAHFCKNGGGIRTDTAGFQCVELAVRYFNFKQHVPAGNWHIPTAWAMHNNFPSDVETTGTPVPGDLAVFPPGSDGAGSAGHVAIVTAVRGSTVDLFQQNWWVSDCNQATFRKNAPMAGKIFLHSKNYQAPKVDPPSSSGTSQTGSTGSASPPQQPTPPDPGPTTPSGPIKHGCWSDRYLHEIADAPVVQDCDPYECKLTFDQSDAACVERADPSAWDCSTSGTTENQHWVYKNSDRAIYKCESGAPMVMHCPGGTGHVSGNGSDDSCE